ncbi:hypothetical protein UlMin_038693 [Ulmus minor]
MERERKREGSSDEEKEFEEEMNKRKWWKRAVSLAMRRETVEANTPRSGRHIVRNGITVASFFDRLVIHPDNWWYVGWTHLILIWAVYSSFFTPLEFGFFRGLHDDLFLLDIAGQFAFLLDILVRFFVAYRDFHSHRIVYDRKLIAIRSLSLLLLLHSCFSAISTLFLKLFFHYFSYLKSRFTVDLLGCLPWDAIYKASGRKELVRYLLWIRLSRACRVTEFFGKLEKDIRINYLFTRIAKLFVVELYCTHTAACIFYYLATTLPPNKEGYTWIGSLKMGDYSYSHFRDIDLWKRYITSLYFAIVTMATLGYGDIHAVNVREMIFVMIFVSLDMFLGAYLLGNITALIVKGSNTEKFRDKMADLIKYMNRNKIDKHISKNIKDHLRLQYDRRYTEASGLNDIPASILTKISQNLYESYIKEVPLFKGCSFGFIKQIAIIVHEEFFLPGEVIIEQGSITDQLYIVCHGALVRIFLFLYRSANLLLIWGGFFSLNTPQRYSIVVRELCRVLRVAKQSFMEILEIFFLDGRIILNNLLEGKDSSIQNKLLESDITLYIGTHELELATRVNCASHLGDLYRLKCLIGAGADPNNTDYDGRSALHVAASKGYEDITIFLIERGVDVNISDKFGYTPLLEAIKNGHDRVVSLLTNAGAKLSIDGTGSFLCNAVAMGDMNLLKRLLAEGVNPNAKNYDRRTPLHIAASEGLYSMAEFILDAGASVYLKDRWGNTPIDEARIGGNKNLLKLLEVAKSSQMSEFSNSSKEVQARQIRN